MKAALLRVAIYLTIVLVIFSAFWYLNNNIINAPSKRVTNLRASSLGNFLSRYFYYISANQLNSKNIQQIITLDMGNDKQLVDFYSHLDWQPLLTSTKYVSDPSFTWLQIYPDGQLKSNYLHYWQTMRPKMQQTFAQAIPPVQVDQPVVHFRCSDVPFNKHAAHNLSTANSVNWMAQQIKEKGFNQVVLLACHAHLSQAKGSCDKYVAFYTHLFNDAGIAVKTQCGSIMHDFAMMYYSPLLISLNASSYSFMAGIAKDPNTYISCNMGLEIQKKYVAQTAADWILDPRAPLLHSKVTDYHFTRDVISKLQRN